MKQLDWTCCAVTLPARNSWIPLISAPWRRWYNLYWFTYMALHIAQKTLWTRGCICLKSRDLSHILIFRQEKAVLFGRRLRVYETFKCQKLILGEAIWNKSRPFVTACSLTFVLTSTCSQIKFYKGFFNIIYWSIWKSFRIMPRLTRSINNVM